MKHIIVDPANIKSDIDLAFESDMIIGNINSPEIKILKNKIHDLYDVIQRGNTLYFIKRRK